MPKLKKATPLPTRFKACMFGPPGSGKSFTALLWAEGLAALRGTRVAIIDTEFSTKHYRIERPDCPVHPAPFDFDVIDSSSLADFTEFVDELDPQAHGVVIVDQVTSLWDNAQEGAERNAGGQIKMFEWGKVKGPFMKPMKRLIYELDVDVILIARQMNDWQGEDIVGVRPAAEKHLGHEPDFLIQMENYRSPSDRTNAKITAFFEKDRTSSLSAKTLTDPTWEMLRPVIERMSPGQVVSESDEERLAKDADMLRTQEAEAEKARVEKSSQVKDDCIEAVYATESMLVLENATRELLSQKKRWLQEPEDLKAVTEAFVQRREQLKSKETVA